MCDCLHTVENMLRERYRDPEGYLDANIGLFSKTEDKPLITYKTRTKKKDGSLTKHETSVSVSPTYCPFCGKKYEEG